MLEFLFVAYIKLLNKVNIIEYNVKDNLAFNRFIKEDQNGTIRASISTDKGVDPFSP